MLVGLEIKSVGVLVAVVCDPVNRTSIRIIIVIVIICINNSEYESLQIK